MRAFLGQFYDETKYVPREVLVSDEQKDMVLEAMYKAGQLDRTGGGFMYMTPLEKLATYIPDSILDRLKKKGKVRRAV